MLVGISAINIDGTTVDHYTVGFYQQKKFRSVLQRAKTKLASVEFILFDEISMISAVNFNAIDAMLRAAKEVNLPMGGVHVVGA